MRALIEDTRQKKGKHKAKHDRWDADGVTVIRGGLPFADYWPAPKIAIDTKMDIAEIAMNLCGAYAERKRVQREIELAREAGAHLVFLVEDARFSRIDDLRPESFHLRSGQTIPGDQLANAMTMHEQRFGCEFRFCRPKDAGRVIEELLRDG